MRVQRRLNRRGCSEGLEIDAAAFVLPITKRCWLLTFWPTIFGLACCGETFKHFVDRPHIARITG